MTGLGKYLLPLLVLRLAPAALGQLTNFEVIDYPGAAATFVYGINDAGDIVGMYQTPDQKRHGFLLRGGRFTTIDYPGATGTWAHAVNASGDVAGVYADSANLQHGYALSNGNFKAIDFPGAGQTMIYGMNSRGDLTGMYFAPGDTSKHFGWVLLGGRYFTIDHPSPNNMSCGTWIGEDGEVGGHVKEKNGAYHGYIWKDGKFTLIPIEGGAAWQYWDSIYGVDAAGQILATYTDARGKQRGVLIREGVHTTFDVPGSQRTRAQAINRSGQVVGLFADGRGVTHGFLTRVAPNWHSQLLTVDDDGADCPGALRTIQAAVAQAPSGATIQVCPGIYFKSVAIVGPEKNALKLIALGGANDVILQGDYTERDGFHLEKVSNVAIRGFTVRDFGNKPTTATEWGAGNQIYLEDAHYNTIENNRLINGDMMGIMLVNSSNNTVQHNLAFVDNSNLANCGIHVQGANSANNVFRQNMAFGNKFAGIMIRGAGPGNVVMDNTIVSNGRFGIDVQNTSEIRIEGNRVSYNRGFWGISPGGQQPGLGVNLVNVDKSTVFDNRLRGNSGADLTWDGKGENQLQANACETSNPAGLCSQ
jgi:parallel beta-helix repeat protein